MGVKLNSRSKERSDSGVTSSVTMTGSKDDIETLYNSLLPGMITENGRVAAVRMFQESPQIWACEIRYGSDPDGNDNDEPNTAYGKKSAQLTGSMLSLPLEAHPRYLVCWNHYLVAAPGTNTVPAWWKTAKEAIISGADNKKYLWVKDLSAAPQDKSGLWHAVKSPLKAGTETFDVAVYSITETIKCRSCNAAGALVANQLNKIGKPTYTLGITGGDWKCDNANVFWGGKAWFATLTWTRSGNNQGWDKDIYGVIL